jgi:hypothetical protein
MGAHPLWKTSRKLVGVRTFFSCNGFLNTDINIVCFVSHDEG